MPQKGDIVGAATKTHVNIYFEKNKIAKPST